jgi:chitinase
MSRSDGLSLGLKGAGFRSRACRTIVILLCWVSTVTTQAGLWNSAYYAGWTQNDMPAQAVDFSATTHIIHFSVVPNTNGTLDFTPNTLTVGNSTDLVTRAHAAGVKVLLCVGGADSENGFLGATSAGTLSTFLTNLVSTMTTRGYDGIDVDWEPLPSTDFAQFTNLVSGLRTALNGFSPPKLLTAAVGAYPPYGDSPTAQYTMFAALQSKFDQINIMTYDLSGPYGGWITWFNAPIYDGGTRFPSTGALVPSTDGAVSNFLAGGVAPAKLGIGVAFYGYVWSGGAGTSTGGAALPRQTWTTAPAATAPAYSDIISNYYQPSLYHWDTNAQAAYLSIDLPGSSNDMFISYDDETTCRAKVDYADRRGLGGLIIWHLGAGYRASQPVGQRDLLLQSLKPALSNLFRITSLTINSSNAVVGFSSVSGLNYALESADILSTGSWSAVTDFTALAPITRITNSLPVSTSNRFYRVRH